MQKQYWKYFKTYSWNDYIDEMMNDLKLNVHSYRDSFFFKMMKDADNMTMNYLDILACISYVDEDFFNEIVKKLKNV